jgi:hypothetical protein
MQQASFVLAASACLCASACIEMPMMTASQPPLPQRLMASDPMDPAQEQMLAAHNKYRSEVGVPPLSWSSELASNAQIWAEYLATRAHRLQHSGLAGTGENVAEWTSGHKTPSQLIDLWAEEKELFTPGIFPHVSRTGKWETIAHYSQIIWMETTQVGCGFANGDGNDYLVCLYSPQGNVFTEKVY